MWCRSQCGISLLESLITLALAGMLLAAAIPSVSSWVARHKLITFQHDIYRTFMLARQHAISQAGWVIVCPLNKDGTCALPKGTWNLGWRVFETSGNKDCKLQGNGFCDHGGKVLLERGPVKSGYALTVNSHLARRARFDSLGMSHGYNGRLTVCSKQHPDSLGLVIAQSGRVRKARHDEILPCNP